ncbi:ribonuclease HII [Halobacteriovorax marinus]|uniref:ribonuclease HII n=1 Tax=Halobacteriovorax marinus TaxID=97084 RepID=UPI003A9208D9
MFDLEEIGDFGFLAGCDEVGRGPLAGPVVGCCVLVDRDSLTVENIDFLLSHGITDSKKISATKRKKILKSLGIEKYELASKNSLTLNKNLKISFSVREISNESIDQLNILRASLKAMGDAFIDCFSGERTKLLIDGNKYIDLGLENVSEEFVIKGDSKSALIGLASIIAKEYRDNLMIEMGKKYPGYGLEKHAGYPTKFHKDAISKLGVTPIHRKSFKGVKEFCQQL